MRHSQLLGLPATTHTDPDEDYITVTANTDIDLHLLSGRPLREPIIHYGSFVMNNPEEIEQAIADDQDGRLGQQPCLTAGSKNRPSGISYDNNRSIRLVFYGAKEQNLRRP
ncbi:pirin-like C-terminal cupin domain-containing protein [Oceanobacter sp. 3_MG-2023]|uniref:pirin-like C-terminal cupin domain-containing protein n=1 Tax=Oceanobacter sp. 3_MG-2023 TaxID=3062622 RepID=UPI002734B86E|nr:pirin-like C-terminal cupin domain-containing protein [Oceanobacter sp. 3_MG-2023]